MGYVMGQELENRRYYVWNKWLLIWLGREEDPHPSLDGWEGKKKVWDRRSISISWSSKIPIPYTDRF